MTRILTRSEIESVLTLDDCVAAVEEAFRACGEGHVAPPQSLGTHVAAGAFHIKVAVTSVYAAKINANFPGNPQRNGLPMIQGVILLVDAERGTPLAILDSTLITILRTAAATAVAAKYLARGNARAVTIVGCGNQGRAHLEALARVRPLVKAHAVDRDAKSAARFAMEMRERTGLDVTASSSLDDAIADSDIVVTCTPARSPLLDRSHAHRGVFIAGVGADNPDKHELSVDLLAASRVVADIADQAAAMGDLHHAIAAGAMRRDQLHGELADVVCGRVAARTSDDEIFVFDSTGTALQDAATAALAFERATARGIGTEVAL
jgi:alanine dehydrogenase